MRITEILNILKLSVTYYDNVNKFDLLLIILFRELFIIFK